MQPLTNKSLRHLCWQTLHARHRESAQPSSSFLFKDLNLEDIECRKIGIYIVWQSPAAPPDFALHSVSCKHRCSNSCKHLTALPEFCQAICHTCIQFQQLQTSISTKILTGLGKQVKRPSLAPLTPNH